MSSENEQEESRTTTRVEETEEETAEEVLTPEEEKAVRMRHGLPEDDDRELEFGVGADDEALEKMAKLESFLLEAFETRESGRNYFADDEDKPDTDEESKQKIVDALSDDD